jgi:hypothetical protein
MKLSVDKARHPFFHHEDCRIGKGKDKPVTPDEEMNQDRCEVVFDQTASR